MGLARFALQNLVVEFLNLHPNVELLEQVTSRQVDLVGEGLDLAIRAHDGALPDSDLIQRKVVDVRWGLFASASFVESVGPPASPAEIEGCQALLVGANSQVRNLSLSGPAGESVSIEVQARLCSEDMGTLLSAACEGYGITALPTYVCAEAVAAGRLIRVLPDWTTNHATLYIVSPSRRGTLPAVKAFADHIAEGLKLAVAQ